ncbi:hypothetical protein [Aurantibacter aestuarii]|uniref:Lipocalin-like domain-containing protein n=1 Tax=Aurantibacter aestuarii TaxID=1266046 RepID=A0A2T1NEC8_9FLAO|nr:hypothetical protein [Aurantibacter aestuarii]PSG90798.1 hypothetical protein C7H52_05865 [Aurantibacter aestuarii]
MKKLLLLLVCTLVFTCSKDDSSSETSENIILEGGTIYGYQIVEVEIENASQENYTGFLGDNQIELRRTTENSVAFFVEPDFDLGSTTLTVEALNNLKVNYVIEETSLTQTVEETIQPYFDQLELERQALTPDFNGDKALLLIDGFNNMYASLNDTQKRDLSIFYKANKNLIDATITGDGSKMNSNIVTQFARCEASIYFTGVLGVFTTISTTLPLTQIVTPLLAVSTGVLLAKTYEHCIPLAQASIKNVFVQADDQIFNSKTTNASAISLSSDVVSNVSIQLQNRTMLPSDNGDENTIISTYFSATTSFNELVIQKMNVAINYLNTEWSLFFDITPYDEVLVNDTAVTDTNGMTQEDFNNFTFSVSGSNITLESLDYANGGLDLNVKIIDETAVVGGLETGTLNFTYQDDFNSFSGSFDIEVSTESISGVWKYCYVSDGFCEDTDTLTFNSNGTISTPGTSQFDEIIVNNYTLDNGSLTVNITVRNNNVEYFCDTDNNTYFYVRDYTDTLTLTRVNENLFEGTLSSTSTGYQNPTYSECFQASESESEAITLVKI